MKPHDPKARIAHMLDAARLIEKWTRELARIEYDNDAQIQSALTYQIQVIGEAASRVPTEFQWTHASEREVFRQRAQSAHLLQIDENPPTASASWHPHRSALRYMVL